MSKLNDLIDTLCPDGVEYKRFGDIATVIRGNGLQKNDFTESGIGCIHYGQIYTYYGAFTYETKSFVSPELASKLKKVNTGDLVVAVTSENVEDVCKCVAWLGDEEIVTGGHSAIVKHNQNPKYLSYYFQTEMFFKQKRKIAKGTKVIEVAPQKLEEIIIPVPPLEVQAEIVKILDNFTELTAELTARKQQYEYYRTLLLNFSDDIEKLPLEQVFDMKNGYTPSKANKDFWENGTIPWFRMEDIRTNGRILSDSIQHITPQAVKGKLFPANSIILATTATIGEHALIIADSLANQRFTFFTKCKSLKKELDIKFAYYYFYIIDEWCKQNINVSSFPSVDMAKLRKYKFPIPPIEEQQRIVDILDRFDKLCNDISEGLPAEIEARQKQYAYYRDKLLTFKEIKT